MGRSLTVYVPQSILAKERRIAHIVDGIKGLLACRK